MGIMNLKDQHKQLKKWQSERTRLFNIRSTADKKINRLALKIDVLQEKMPLPDKFIKKYLHKCFKTEFYLPGSDNSVCTFMFITEVVSRLKMRGNAIIFSGTNKKNGKGSTVEFLTDTEILSKDLYFQVNQKSYDMAVDKVNKGMLELLAYRKTPPNLEPDRFYPPPPIKISTVPILDRQKKMAEKINSAGGNMLSRALKQSSPKNLTKKRIDKKRKKSNK